MSEAEDNSPLLANEDIVSSSGDRGLKRVEQQMGGISMVLVN